jgi:tRNA pseudouridine38-40 synthase
MARYKLILAYDGSAFFGSQRQSRRRTVQSELERAASKLGWRGPATIFAGRTDSGVHAEGQVASLDLEWRHAPETLRDALNARLARDVAVLTVERAAPEFHPRFDAVARRYRYDIRLALLRHPLADRLAWRIWPAVPLASLNGVAGLLRGSHDFAAFGSAAHAGGGTSRTVTLSEWSSEGDLLRYEIEADGFLFRMVRRLVFVQVAVAQGRCSDWMVRQALQEGRRPPGLPVGMAPPDALRLMEVRY